MAICSLRADEDREIERAFAAELRARGAYLEGETSPVACPHGRQPAHGQRGDSRV